MSLTLSNSLTTNIMFLILLLFFTGYSIYQKKKQTSIAFVIVTILYVIYIYRTWF
ncbi:hypothetical protein SAMN02745245_00762 [Anaerosphaera aminiphila DSM 21120]|uniref:Uncharacterized protein n=1 Tax=Anaerosphaera aminiphila DSM 21120 TaxID=1120995 RepID=A0A1M5QVN1_9FIRM|nr:hypothetical protein SAMN02745245_00762 [Anaerosphaera aminiphila DSM 21120]